MERLKQFTTMETYDVDYFIKKFEAIPEGKIITRTRSDGKGKGCAHGWCSGFSLFYTEGEEEQAFSKLASEFGLKGFASINNGEDSRYQQPTPKQRILAALYDIKARQQPEPVKEVEPVKERTVYVTVDAAVRKLQKEIAEN